jgi:hypothetical protein
VGISDKALPIDNLSSSNDLFNATKCQILKYNELSIRGGRAYAN